MYTASLNGNASLCRLFIERGASVEMGDEDGTTPLFVAALYGHDDVVDLLIEMGANLDSATPPDYIYPLQAGFTPLHAAVLQGNATLCRRLAGAGVRMTPDSRNQWTPLHLAAKMGRADICAILAEAGADIEARDKAGRTPLLVAVKHGKIKSAQTLIDFGADMDARTGKDRSVLDLCKKGTPLRAFIEQRLLALAAGSGTEQEEDQGEDVHFVL